MTSKNQIIFKLDFSFISFKNFLRAPIHKNISSITITTTKASPIERWILVDVN